MLSRLFGEGHAVMAVGDPNQAIYGWRGRVGVQHPRVRRRLPRAVGRARRCTTSPSAVAPTGASSRSPTSSRSRLRRAAAGRAARAGPDAGEGVVQHRRPRDPRRRAGLARRRRRRRPHRRRRRPLVRHRGAHPRQRARRGRLRRAHRRRRSRSRSSGLSGLLRLPEVAEVVATLRLLHDVTANAALLTLLTGPRWAVGPRDLRLLARRAAADRRPAAGPRRASRCESVARPAGPHRRRHRPRRGARARRRAGRPRRRCRTPTAALERFGLLAAELRYGCAATSGSRCSTSCGGSSTPPASTSSWPRRSARPRPPGATTSTCS